MFKWIFRCAGLIAFIWFATTVELGSRTLVGHMVAIGRTKEAKEFAAGTRDEAVKMVSRVQQEIQGDAGAPAPSEKPRDPVELEEQQALQKTVEERTAKKRPRPGHRP